MKIHYLLTSFILFSNIFSQYRLLGTIMTSTHYLFHWQCIVYILHHNNTSFLLFRYTIISHSIFYIYNPFQKWNTYCIQHYSIHFWTINICLILHGITYSSCITMGPSLLAASSLIKFISSNVLLIWLSGFGHFGQWKCLTSSI